MLSHSNNPKGKILTFALALFDVENPTPLKVHKRDIAHALANTCRFGGHCGEFYSVAQHTVIMTRLIYNKYGRGTARHALLHDAHEAYIGDIPTTLRGNVNTLRVDEAIYERFGLEPPTSDEAEIVNAYDVAMLWGEFKRFFGENYARNFVGDPSHTDIEIITPVLQQLRTTLYDPRRAEIVMLDWFKLLGIE